MKRSLHALAALGAMISGLSLSPEASAARFYNVLLNVDSGLCVDVPGLSTGNVLVQQYPCNYGQNQYWTLEATSYAGWYTVRNLHSGKCLEIPGWSTDDGELAQQYTCNGGTNQMWYAYDLGGGETAYINGYSGKCLDVAGGTSAPGYHLQQFGCHFSDNQRFEDGLYGVSVSH